MSSAQILTSKSGLPGLGLSQNTLSPIIFLLAITETILYKVNHVSGKLTQLQEVNMSNFSKALKYRVRGFVWGVITTVIVGAVILHPYSEYRVVVSNESNETKMVADAGDYSQSVSKSLPPVGLQPRDPKPAEKPKVHN